MAPRPFLGLAPVAILLLAESAAGDAPGSISFRTPVTGLEVPHSLYPLPPHINWRHTSGAGPGPEQPNPSRKTLIRYRGEVLK